MTSRIRLWSSTAASNNATPPNGAPEGGTYINQISDILRQIMAEVRAFYETSGWIDYGHTPTYASGTVFTVTGNQTAIYEVNRRVRAISSLGVTVFGTITASVFSTTTSVTVIWDSGSMDSNLSEVAVGAAPIANPWLSFKSLAGTLLRSQLPAEAIFQTGMGLPFFGSVAPTGWVLWFGTIGSASSGASNRSNADTEALYKQLWDTFANSEAPVTGGRGASAAADFAANKPIAFPDGRGCVIAVLDNLGGTAANRITSGVSQLDGTKLGARGGDERVHQHTHTATVTDLGHSHAIPSSAPGGVPGSNFSPGQGGSTNSTNPATTGISVSNANFGSGSSQNVQPTIMLPYIVKL